jgi:hypothetical protein
LTPSDPGQQGKPDVISLSSTSVGQTTGETTGLFELSMQNLDTPASFEVRFNFLTSEVNLTGTDVIRATVFGHKPKYSNSTVTLEIDGQSLVWYL